LLEEVFDSDDKLTNAAFFQAIFYAFPTIAAIAYGRYANYKEDSFYEVIKPLKGGVDWALHAGTNRKAIAAFGDAIVGSIEGNSVSTDLL
jgi:hypothetical protein